MSRNRKGVLNPTTYESEELRIALKRAQGRNKKATLEIVNEKRKDWIGSEDMIEKFTFGKLDNFPMSANETFTYLLPLTKTGKFRTNGKIHLAGIYRPYKPAVGDKYIQEMMCKQGDYYWKETDDFNELTPMYYPFNYYREIKNVRNPKFNEEIKNSMDEGQRFLTRLISKGKVCEKCAKAMNDYITKNFFTNPKGVIKEAEYQPNQSLEDYSPTALTNSSAIQGFEPLKYSIGPSSLGAEDNDLICSQCGSNSVQKFKDFELGDWEICFDCGKAVEITDDWVIDIDWDTPPTDKPDIFEESIEWDAETLLNRYASEQNMEWYESPKWAIAEFQIPPPTGFKVQENKRYSRPCRYLKNGPNGYDLLISKRFGITKISGGGKPSREEINTDYKGYCVYIITPEDKKENELKYNILDVKQLKNAKKKGLDMLKQLVEGEKFRKGQIQISKYEMMARRKLGAKIKKSPKIKFTVQAIGDEVVIYAESQEFKPIEFLRGELMTLKQQKTTIPQYYFSNSKLKKQITTATYDNDFLKYVADYFVITNQCGEPYYSDSTSVIVYTVDALQLICDTFSDYFTGTADEKTIAKENIPPYINKILESRKGKSYCDVDNRFGKKIKNFDVSEIPCVVLDTHYRLRGNYNNPSWKRIIKGNYMLVEFRFAVGRDGMTASKFEHTFGETYARQQAFPDEMMKEMKEMIDAIVYRNRKTIRKDISAEGMLEILLSNFMQYFGKNEKILSEYMNTIEKGETKGYNRWNLELADGSSVEPFVFVGTDRESVIIKDGDKDKYIPYYSWKHDVDEDLIVKDNQFRYVSLTPSEEEEGDEDDDDDGEDWMVV